MDQYVVIITQKEINWHFMLKCDCWDIMSLFKREN